MVFFVAAKAHMAHCTPAGYRATIAWPVARHTGR